MTQLQHMPTTEKAHGCAPSAKGNTWPSHQPSPSHLPPARPTIPCAKCQANLLAASYWDGPDTLVCIPCGTQISRPLTRLTTEEEEANQLAVTHATVLDPPSAHDNRIDDETDLLEDSAETHDSEDTDSADITEDRVSPYEDDFTISLLPETTPLDQAELDDSRHVRQSPPTLADRRAFDGHPTSSGHDDSTSHCSRRRSGLQRDLRTSRRRGDRPSRRNLLHLPACQLFKSSQSPLRRAGGPCHPTSRRRRATHGRLFRASAPPDAFSTKPTSLAQRFATSCRSHTYSDTEKGSR